MRRLLAAVVALPGAILLGGLVASAAGSVSMVGTGCTTGSGFCFSPPTVTVPVGSTVTWTNNSFAPHTATADSGAWNTGLVGTGMSRTITLSAVGSFPYHCSVHPDMHGTVVVTAAATPAVQPSTSSLGKAGAGPLLPMGILLIVAGLVLFAFPLTAAVRRNS